MAKALKTAALVVGAVALVATGVGAVALGGLAGAVTIGGVSASTLFLVSGGLTVASSLLQKTPKVPAAQTDRLNASVNPRAFRQTILGQTAWPVEIRYEEWSGKDQEYCDWIVLHASHASDSLDEIWFENEMAWSATTGVVGKWAGYFSVPHIVLEGSAANAFSIGSGRWNQSARLTGCTYSHWRFKVTGNGKKAESPFSSGLPSRITVIGRGAKLYDPRRDSTVPGGSGPMRAADQSTWRYTADDGAVIGENLALHTLRVALGWRIKNPATGEMRLATGSGVPARRLNLQSWIVAANLADEQVNRSAGGTEPRYHGACVISEGDDPKSSLDMLCTACCGRFRDTAGKLSFTIAHNDLAGAAIDDGLNTDDVVGAFTWDPDAALEATPNIARGKYVDASVNSLYQMIDYPEVRLPSPDGQDRIFPLDLGAVESPSQAQRIAKQVLQRKQYPRRFSAPFDIRAWKYSVGDVVPFTFAPLGFTRALFRVEEQELGQGGTCNMTLLVENASLYAWDKDDAAPVQAAAPIVYDNRNNPLILAIADAATTAEWPGVGDPAGTKPDDNATNSADPDSAFGPGTVRETLATLGRIEPLGLAVIDQEALARQRGRDVGRMSEALMQALLENNRARETMRDAGIVIDPATGKARIYGLDVTGERVSRVEVDLDATKSSIRLLATSDYVNEQIARAQLDPSGQAALDEIIARLTSAEIEIDGLDAKLVLKADATVLTTLSGTVSEALIDIDALEAAVSLKASRTEVDRIDTRVSAAELKLSTLGDVASLAIAVRQARYASDDAATGALASLLTADEQNRRQLRATGEARQELAVDLAQDRAAAASFQQFVTVEVGDTKVAVERADRARIEGDRATAVSIEQVSAALGTERGRITETREVLIGPEGTTLRALTALDANGRIVGVVQTATGTRGDYAVVSDTFAVVDPVTGNPLFFVDKDGAIAASFKRSAIGYDNLEMGAAQRSAWYPVQQDVAVGRGVTVQIVSLTFDKIDADSALKICFYGNIASPDDLQFTGAIAIDGAVVQPVEVNIVLDTGNSAGRMPITPFAFVTGIAAGRHTVTFTLTNTETDNVPLTVRAGSTLEVTELRKASLGSVSGSGAVVVSPGGGGTGGGTGSGGGYNGGGGIGGQPINQQ